MTGGGHDGVGVDNADLRVGCVGLGVIGCNWAALFLARGFKVMAHDTDESVCRTAPEKIAEALAVMVSAGAADSVRQAMDRLLMSADLSDCIAEADYVQESASERLEVKRALFERFDRDDQGRTLYGSSTSALPGSAFMGGLEISRQAMVVHPVNPPFAVPLVELCHTPWTSDETAARIRQLMTSAGQTAVTVKKEVTGYVLNRLQAAVVGEALHLVATGVIEPEDLDAVMSRGLAPRWSIGGPFRTGRFNAPGGYQDYMTKYGDVYRDIINDLNVSFDWSDETLAYIDERLHRDDPTQSYEEASAMRDRALLRLNRFLDQVNDAARD